MPPVPPKRVFLKKSKDIPKLSDLRQALDYAHPGKDRDISFYKEMRKYSREFVTSRGIKGENLHRWKDRDHQDGLYEMATAFLDRNGNGPKYWPDDSLHPFYGNLQYSKHSRIIKPLLVQLFYRSNQQRKRLQRNGESDVNAEYDEDNYSSDALFHDSPSAAEASQPRDTTCSSTYPEAFPTSSLRPGEITVVPSDTVHQDQIAISRDVYEPPSSPERRISLPDANSNVNKRPPPAGRADRSPKKRRSRALGTSVAQLANFSVARHRTQDIADIAIPGIEDEEILYEDIRRTSRGRRIRSTRHLYTEMVDSGKCIAPSESSSSQTTRSFSPESCSDEDITDGQATPRPSKTPNNAQHDLARQDNITAAPGMLTEQSSSGPPARKIIILKTKKQVAAPPPFSASSPPPLALLGGHTEPTRHFVLPTQEALPVIQSQLISANETLQPGDLSREPRTRMLPLGDLLTESTPEILPEQDTMSQPHAPIGRNPATLDELGRFPPTPQSRPNDTLPSGSRPMSPQVSSAAEDHFLAESNGTNQAPPPSVEPSHPRVVTRHDASAHQDDATVAQDDLKHQQSPGVEPVQQPDSTLPSGSSEQISTLQSLNTANSDCSKPLEHPRSISVRIRDQHAAVGPNRAVSMPPDLHKKLSSPMPQPVTGKTPEATTSIAPTKPTAPSTSMPPPPRPAIPSQGRTKSGVDVVMQYWVYTSPSGCTMWDLKNTFAKKTLDELIEELPFEANFSNISFTLKADKFYCKAAMGLGDEEAFSGAKAQFQDQMRKHVNAQKGKTRKIVFGMHIEPEWDDLDSLGEGEEEAEAESFW